MANKYMQFISSTTKDGFLIKGSDNLYVFQITTGMVENPREAFRNYLYSKNNMYDKIEESNSQTGISESSWVIIKKPDSVSFEEFVEGVKKYEYPYVAGTKIIPTRLNCAEVDMNLNILLKSEDSHLEDEMGVGNILINRKGEVIRAPQPSVLIQEPDKRTGFYPIEIYESQIDKNTGKKTFCRKLYNFLNPEGKILCDKYNFECHLGEEEMISVPRNFYMKDGKNVYSDWGILPNAYVHCIGRQPTLYLSAVDVLIENRRRLSEGLEPIVNDEKTYLEEYFLRKARIEKLFKELSDKLKSANITQTIYDKIEDMLKKECAMNNVFEENYKTPQDEHLENTICGQSM